MRRLGAIDLGTNTVRLLVVEASGATWRVLDEAQRVTRLGEGQGEDGALRAAPVSRTVAAVSEYVRRAEAGGAMSIRIVATSAVREAPNRSVLTDGIRADTGRSVEVLSGLDEARLALAGVAGGLPGLGGRFVLVDIGGGSTELVLASEGRVETAVSLRLGVVALAERFMDDHPVDPARHAAMVRQVQDRLGVGLPASIRSARASGAAPVLVGTAGTVTAVAALDLGLARYEATRVQGHVLTRTAVDGQRRRLSALSLAERAALPCLERGRADVLVPGIAICLAVMDTLGFTSLMVSDHGLREGILRETLAGAAPA